MMLHEQLTAVVRPILLLALAELYAMGPAWADLVPGPNGGTLDTATSLEWFTPLASPEIRGLSYNAVVASDLYANGWRHATGAELCELLSRYSEPQGGCNQSALPVDAFLSLFNGLGSTGGGICTAHGRGMYDDGDPSDGVGQGMWLRNHCSSAALSSLDDDFYLPDQVPGGLAPDSHFLVFDTSPKPEGRVPVVFANFGRNRICNDDGTGNRVCADVSDDVHMTRGVALGHLNDDSHLDIVFANRGSRNRVCLGDALGQFTCSNVSDHIGDAGSVALGLVNEDSFLDAVFAYGGDPALPNLVCLGDGTGAFPSCTAISGDPRRTQGVALGYVDGDAHLDAVFANDDQGRNRLCLGNGAGGFGCSDISTDGGRDSEFVALGFLDSGQTLDAVFANGSSQKNRVCLQGASGLFTCSDVSPEGNSSEGVALGDIDRDGDLDVLVANDQGVTNRVCLNDGDGSFPACTAVSPSAGSSSGVSVGFVDGDAVLDAVISNGVADQNEWCFGNGGGGFSCIKLDGESDWRAVAVGASCGDAVREGVIESCDDGNVSDGDCCSATCQFQDASGVGGIPNCCAMGVCQIGVGCGAICFTPGAICKQPGGAGTACTCELP